MKAQKVLIVHVHPEENSFCSALKNTAIEHFTNKGAQVKVSDLYKMNFNPVGGKHDFTTLQNNNYFKYQLEQVNAYQNNLFADDVKLEMEKLEWCDTLIFNFPLWWFGLPALLKGWVDRVFAMGFIYGAGKGVYDAGTFKNKTAFLTFTTGGPELAYGPNGKNGSLDVILYPIQHGMFYFAGMKTLPPFVCFSPVRMDDNTRTNELLKYKNYLSSIDDKIAIY
jgi:NAD(P)H dehydrogenase (quinone)